MEPITIDRETALRLVEKGRRKRWITRKGSSPKRHIFFGSDGLRITDEEMVSRIRSMAIPPAWQFVRISPTAGSKVQAVGIDGNGRLQYIYNRKFAERQQRKKFAKIERFGDFLPGLRKMTNEHIQLDGFPREKVLAIMIRLINSLYIRVGTEKSVRQYKTYGITTLKNRHLTIGKNGRLTFEFVGKSHVVNRRVLVDMELASMLEELKDLGNSRKLFHYHDDDGIPRRVTPRDLNQYLKTATSSEFSAKDFRTWGATLLAAVELAELGPAPEPKVIKENIVKAIRKVSEQLSNTPAVCRSSYIHPIVLEAYADGVVLDQFRPRGARHSHRLESEVEPEEYSLMQLFRNYRK